MNRTFMAILGMVLAAGLLQSVAADEASLAVPETSRDGSSTLPEELRGMQELFGNEKELVDAVRAFDQEQEGLAEWDDKMADELAKAGQKELAETKRAQAQHRFELVELAYQEVLKRYPEDARALTYYGELQYDHLGGLDEAVQSWKLATALDPKLSAPCNDLGIHYCHVGAYEQGLRYFERALELDPKNSDYLYNVAQIYLVNGPQVGKHYKWDPPRVYREAMKLSQRAAELAPDDYDLVQDYAVNFFAAENFGVKADWAEAAKAWQRARGQARRQDEVFYTWLNEGRVRLRQGEPAQAAACLDEALKLRPDSDVAKRLREKVAASVPAEGSSRPASPKPDPGAQPSSPPEPPSEKAAHPQQPAQEQASSEPASEKTDQGAQPSSPPEPASEKTARPAKPMNKGRLFHKE